MASKPKNTTKRKTDGGKTASGKKNSSQEVSFGSEVVLLVLLAVCIILFISNFGIGGFIGEKVSAFCFGLFGMMAYLFPVCFFMGAAFFVSNRNNRIAVIKLTAGVIFVLFLCLFMELVAGESGEYQIGASFQYAAEHKSGGGALGGLLAVLLCPAIGKPGAYIVDVIALIIALVLLTERSFLSGVKKGSRKVYDTAREDAARRREQKELRREEENRRRTDRKVEGVALDTRILPVSPERSDNISELKLPVETEAFSRELKEKLFSDRGKEKQGKTTSYSVLPGNSFSDHTSLDEEVHSNPVRNVVGWDSQEAPSSASVLEMPVKRETKQPQELFSEPVVVEKIHRSPRRSRKVSEIPESPEIMKIMEQNDQTDTGAGEILYTGEEPLVINSEPSFTDEIFAGLESAIISEASQEAEDSMISKSPVSEKEQEPEETIPELKDMAGLLQADSMAENLASPEPEHIPESVTAAKPVTEAPAAVTIPPRETVPPVRATVPAPPAPPKPEYVFPPASLLKKGTGSQGDSRKHLQETALKLQQTLKNFGVNVTITDGSCGPSVTRYEMQPEMGVKVSKIVNLADDIKLNLAAADIRIEAPIPGKAAVGIEVPNKENVMVRFRDMIETQEFQNHTSSICFTAGKDIGGQAVVADIAKMPHLLIAGATGSGKSVCINTIIMSILYKADPEDVKLILIDPKVVELSVYNGIPHLLIPVVTDPKKAAGALHWAVAEMMDRYQKFADCQVRDLKGYNQKIAAIEHVEDETKPTKLPQIVVIVDELADLMMVAPGDVEDAICRLAQLARAAGIHLIIATQRPSVDVITGLIKANMPSRIAFSVSSGVDSRTILDMNGAEKLLGNGDMLFYPQGYQKPLRVQGPFVSDSEVEEVVDFLKKQGTVAYNPEVEAKMNTVSAGSGTGSGSGNERDAYFLEAGKFVIEKEKGSIGMLQRMFKIGFNRAARIMDQLEEAGVVGPEEGTKPRKVQMTMSEFETYAEEHI